jgi:hypothetical protein
MEQIYTPGENAGKTFPSRATLLWGDAAGAGAMLDNGRVFDRFGACRKLELAT